MTKERELKEAVREGRDRVSIFDFFLVLTHLPFISRGGF